LEQWEPSTGETFTTMLVEPGVLDANILAYAVNADAPRHAVSRGLLEAARDHALRHVADTLRVLFGYHQPAPGCSGHLSKEALRTISAVLACPGLHVLPAPARTVVGWMELLRRHPVTGGDVFDLQIVATMQANGVRRIYTFNASDFEIFPELTVVTP
jgi:predicted nucleic acid-binding protein